MTKESRKRVITVIGVSYILIGLGVTGAVMLFVWAVGMLFEVWQ